MTPLWLQEVLTDEPHPVREIVKAILFFVVLWGVVLYGPVVASWLNP